MKIPGQSGHLPVPVKRGTEISILHGRHSQIIPNEFVGQLDENTGPVSTGPSLIFL
jgi:hypothetical protein